MVPLRLKNLHPRGSRVAIEVFVLALWLLRSLHDGPQALLPFLLLLSPQPVSYAFPLVSLLYLVLLALLAP